MRHEVIDDLVAKHIPENAYAEQWDVAGLQARLRERPQPRPADRGLGQGRGHRRRGDPRAHHAGRRRPRPPTAPSASARRSCAYVEKLGLLQTLDHLWREHLVNLDHLRSVVGFRGYAQRDPLNEYKAEAFELFQAMLAQSAPGRHRRS